MGLASKLTSGFFDKDLPFEYRLRSIFFIQAFLLSILSFATNAVLGESTVGIVVQAIVNIMFIVVFLLPVDLKRKLLGPFLLFLIYFFIPFMFFQFGGVEGSVLFFAILGSFMLAFLYKGTLRLVLLLLNIAVYVVAVMIQLTFPELVTPMGGQLSRVIDSISGLVFTMGSMFIIAYYISKAYETERIRSGYLLEEVERKRTELEEISIRDALTGIYNRRYLTEVFEQVLVRSAREKKSACAIMFDIDFFKKVNDDHGHVVGDEVLVGVVEAARKQLRQYDMIARYGGEEFLVVLYPETLDNAVVVAERIRKAVEATEYGSGLSVTVSLGVTQSLPGENADELLRRVDACLYAAKNSGRNRVEFDKAS